MVLMMVIEMHVVMTLGLLVLGLAAQHLFHDLLGLN